MNFENLKPKTEFSSILTLPTRTANTSIASNQITYTWQLDWSSVFKNYPNRNVVTESVYEVKHEFFGDHLSGPVFGVGYTVEDLKNSPQTTNFLVTCSFAESGGVGAAVPGSIPSPANVINTVSWNTPIGAVSLQNEIGYFAVRAATESTFITRHPERSQTIALTFVPNNAAYDPTDILSDTEGVHLFHFRWLH